jgi:hypothetical protein
MEICVPLACVCVDCAWPSGVERPPFGFAHPLSQCEHQPLYSGVSPNKAMRPVSMESFTVPVSKM